MVISNPLIVALDSMIFIYLLEADQRYLKKVQTLFVKIESGEVQAITSIVTPLETLSSVKLHRQPKKQKSLELFFRKMPNLSIVSMDFEIALIAAKLRRNHKHLRSPDSIQLATAIRSKADIFLTNDRKLKSVDSSNQTKIALLDSFDISKL